MNGIPKPPTFRSIALGIVLFIATLLAFLRISDVIKISGAALMFLPSRLGLIDMVMPKEVTPLPLAENPSEITFASPGKYVMYLNNYDLLVVHDAIVAGESDPWLKIQSKETGSQIELTLISRGLAWYDTPFASGRPVVTFTVDQAGTYQFIHPARQDTMYLMPDRVTGQESLIVLWVLAEITLILGIIFFLVFRRTAPARAMKARFRAENRARVENTRKRIEERWKENGAF